MDIGLVFVEQYEETLIFPIGFTHTGPLIIQNGGMKICRHFLFFFLKNYKYFL